MVCFWGTKRFGSPKVEKIQQLIGSAVEAGDAKDAATFTSKIWGDKIG